MASASARDDDRDTEKRRDVIKKDFQILAVKISTVVDRSSMVYIHNTRVMMIMIDRVG